MASLHIGLLLQQALDGDIDVAEYGKILKGLRFGLPLESPDTDGDSA